VGVEGTPADCVRLGLHHLALGTECVVAGINAGGNLGIDVLHSGTVAAAREAAIHGRGAIAFSQYIARGRAIDWPRAARWGRRVLEMLLGRQSEPGTFWNVNFPHPDADAPEPEIVFCPLDPSPLPLSYVVEGAEARYSGVYQDRPRRVGTDVARCFGGAITISRLAVFPPDEVGLNPP
jgi:5'-nucleotidase